MKLVARGNFSYEEMGEHLNLAPATVQKYVEVIARQIEGDLPMKTKIVVWWRLTNHCDVFTGVPLSASRG